MFDEQTVALSLKAAYKFASENGLQSEAEEIRKMQIGTWTIKTKSSVRRGYMVELLSKRGLLDNFKAKHWAFGMTPAGQSKQRHYLDLKRRYEDYLNQTDNGNEEAEDEPDIDDAEQQFALESDLRDYLANNLNVIEPGLQIFRSDDRTGVEFAIDNGQIDILATDREGKHLVIELKVSRGRNRTIGQLLYYMGWVDQHLHSGPCRGMIVANDISDDLMLAVKRVPGVSLFRYRLSVTVERVGL